MTEAMADLKAAFERAVSAATDSEACSDHQQDSAALARAFGYLEHAVASYIAAVEAESA